MKSISQRIAEELGVREWQVEAAISLLDEGATVPFIARYRKEATGTAMSKTFVKDPRAVAKPGGIVRVKVLDIDPARRRIALTMRLDDPDAEVKSGRRPDTERRGESIRTTSIQQPTKAAAVAPVAIGGAIAEPLHRAGLKPDKQGSSGPRTDRRR